MGIRHVEKFSDLMHIPISSFVRVWWDRQRQPYKYEFRGAEYQGYHNPGEIIHFNWNPVDASTFGTGFGVSVASERIFDMVISADKTQQVTMPSMLDRKYGIQFIMQMASQRYVPRNVYSVEDGSEGERGKLQSFVEQLQVGQDLVSGTGIKIQELGTNTRTFNPEEHTEANMAPIMKALNDFSGKQGSDNTPNRSNAEQADDTKESGLAAFTINAKIQLAENLFKPWYVTNPYPDPNYGGLIPIEWDDIDFELNFGAIEKKDIPVEQLIKLIEVYQANPILMQNTKPLIEMLKMAGVPIDEDTANSINMMYNDPTGQLAMNQAGIAPQLPPYSDMGGGEIYPEFNNNTMGSPPMDNGIYDSMAMYPRGAPLNFSQSDPSQDWQMGRNYETRKKK